MGHNEHFFYWVHEILVNNKNDSWSSDNITETYIELKLFNGLLEFSPILFCFVFDNNFWRQVGDFYRIIMEWSQTNCFNGINSIDAQKLELNLTFLKFQFE